MGFEVGTSRGVRSVGTTGSSIGFRALLTRYPQQHVVLAGLCNADNARPYVMFAPVAEAMLAEALLPKASVAQNPAGARTATIESGAERHAGVFENPERNQVTWIIARNGKLFGDGRDGRFPLQQIEPGRYALPWGSTMAFTTNDADHFVRTDGATKLRFERRPVVTLQRDQLTEYAGVYFSDELRAAYEVVATDTALTFRALVGDLFTLAPSFRDAFETRSDGYLINVKFQRDSRSRISGFALNFALTNGIRFVRQAK
jgi:hypothetical protein